MFGENLKKLRKSYDLKQSEAAELVGIKQQRWSHYETGLRKPNLVLLKLIADKFGVTVDDLLKECDDERRAGNEDNEAD